MQAKAGKDFFQSPEEKKSADLFLKSHKKYIFRAKLLGNYRIL